MKRDAERIEAIVLRGVVALLIVAPPFLGGGYSSIGLLVLHTAVFLLIAVAWGRVGLPGSSVRKLHPVLMLSAAFVAVSIVSFIQASYRYGSFLTLLDFIIYFFLAVILFRRSWTDRERAGLQWLLLGSTTLQAAVAVFTGLSIPEIRPAGFFANPNQLAAYLGIGLWAAASRFFAVRGLRIRASVLASAGILAAGLILTGSRGGMAAVAVMVLVAILFGASRVSFRRTVASLAIVLVIGTLAAAALAYRFRTRTDPYPYARLQIWAAVTRAIADQPILGMGPGMLEHRYHNYNPPELGSWVRYSKYFRTAHSSYLQILVETGAAGFLCAIATLGMLLWHLGKRYRRLSGQEPIPWVLLALGTLMVHGLVENLLEIQAALLALLLAVGMELGGNPRRGSAGPQGPQAAQRGDGSPGWFRWVGATGIVYLYWILVLSPFLADVHFRKMQAAGDAPEFGRHLSRATRFNPFQPYYFWEAAVRIQRAMPRIDLEQFALVHGYLRTAIRLEPGEPRFHRDLGRLYDRAFRDLFHDLHTMEKAIDSYAEAFTLNTADPRPLVELARLLRLAGRSEEGLRQLDRALEVEPAFGAAHLERLEILRVAGRTAELASGVEKLREDLLARQGYRPRNDYEAGILKVDPERWDRLRQVH